MTKSNGIKIGIIWTFFFESYHYSILLGAPIAAFANKPNLTNRAIILNKLKNIRGFRNRIYHNEPICFHGNTVDFTKAKEVRDDVCLLISWIDPELLSYFNYFDNIEQNIAQADGL